MIMIFDSKTTRKYPNTKHIVPEMKLYPCPIFQSTVQKPNLCILFNNFAIKEIVLMTPYFQAMCGGQEILPEVLGLEPNYPLYDIIKTCTVLSNFVIKVRRGIKCH